MTQSIASKDDAKRDDATSAKLADTTVALGEGATAAPPVVAITPVASLLTRSVLRDGEVVLLILKPSRFYILLSSFPFVAIVAVILGAIHLTRASHTPMRYYVDAALFVTACRIMWGVLNWMGRLYVLTDQRVLRLAGVFTIDIFDCPLRKVGRTRLVRPLPEKLLRLGSVEIEPLDEGRPCSSWQTIRRPKQVQEKIDAAIRKAKLNGCA